MVWLNEAGSPIGFQLSYDKDRAERVLVWKAEGGFSHMAVDDGEGDIGFRYKATPILIADGYFEANQVLKTFEAFSEHVPLEIATFVIDRLKEHPTYEVRAVTRGAGDADQRGLAMQALSRRA